MNIIKKITFFSLLLLSVLLVVGCDNTTEPTTPVESYTLSIHGPSQVMVGTSVTFEVSVDPEVNSLDVSWVSLDTSVATITTEGELTAVTLGEVEIKAIYISETNVEYFSTKTITITDIVPTSLQISGQGTMNVSTSINLMATVSPSNADQSVTWSVSDETLARITESGRVTALKGGTVVITATSKSAATVLDTKTITISAPAPTEMMVTGKSFLEVGDQAQLVATTWPVFSNDEVSFEVENDTIVTIDETGVVTAVSAGTTSVIVTHKTNANLNTTFTIEVSSTVNTNPDDKDLAFVEELMQNMTIEEKIGQMFTVHYWTDANSSNITLSSSIVNEINQYHFGNFILFAYSAGTANGLINLTRNLQKTALASNHIPAFISIDQEGGVVSNATRGLTHYPGQMAVGATKDPSYANQIGFNMGSELRDYGIHVNFSPVLDVNNNMNNPIIGVRSYGDNPQDVADFGIQMFKGLQSAGVVGTAKHFPGHGDTDVDSHLGLPIITHDLERLYEVELFPFIEAIENGIDSIMTTHIIFEALDPNNPATLSYAVLTELLREELGFEGLIVTDAMNMAAITNHYGTGQAAVLSIQAGVDMLTYAGGSDQVTAYNAVAQAVINGDITEARINESVKRILLEKLEKGLFVNPFGKTNATLQDYTSHQELVTEIYQNSLTLVKGDMDSVVSSNKTLIISPVLNSSRYTLRPGLTGNSNSLAFILRSELVKDGYEADYEIIPTSPTPSQISALRTKAQGYDTVIVASANANLAQENLVKQLLADNSDLIVVSLERPYDLVRFQEVNNYIALYGYTPGAVEALIAYFRGEFEATGTLPVQFS